MCVTACQLQELGGARDPIARCRVGKLVHCLIVYRDFSVFGARGSGQWGTILAVCFNANKTLSRYTSKLTMMRSVRKGLLL